MFDFVLLFAVSLYALEVILQISFEAFFANLAELYIIYNKSPNSEWFKKETSDDD